MNNLKKDLMNDACTNMSNLNFKTSSSAVLFYMTGYSTWVPWYPLIIVDCIHATPEWLYNLVLLFCIILILVNTSVAVKVEKKLNYTQAAFVTAIAFVSIGLVLFTFIR